MQRFVQELQIHQIELELQNEALRAAQAKIDATLERYTDHFDFAPVGFFNLAADGTISNVNLTGATMLGVGRERLSGRRLGLFIAEAYRTAFADFLARVFETRIKQTCEFSLESDDQPPKAILMEATLSPDGRECRAAMVDITAHQRATALLVETGALLETLMRNTTDFVYFKDRQSRFVRYSLAFVKHCRLTHSDALIGKTDFDYFTEEHARLAFDDERAIIRTGKSIIDIDEKETHKDGRISWVLTSKMPWCDQAGNIIGTWGISRDITERKLVDAELRKAKEAAEAANRAKGDFLASMSHEIRTPLNGFVGIIDLLLETKLDSHQREYAEIARTSADVLFTLINDILDFSKIEAGKLRLATESFDLLLIIEEAAAILVPRAVAKGLELVIRYAPGTPRRFIGDSARMRQVLLNLAGNAVKFTEKGHVFIDVTREISGDGRAELRLHVQDTGIGIAPDMLGRLFQKFEQGDVGITRRFGGTGLGLAISRELVELMGGEIGVTSVLDSGSTFHVILPLPVATDTADPLPDPAMIAGTRVLVVDDHEINRRVLGEQLTAWRLRNESANSADEALSRMGIACETGDPFSIVLLDYHIPGTDGAALGRSIKSDPRLEKTVLILLTSGIERVQFERSHVVGFACCLLKPVRPSELLETIAAAWSARNAGSDSESLPPDLVAASSKAMPRALVVEDNPVNQRLAQLMLETMNCHVDFASNGIEAIRMVETVAYDLIFMDCEMPKMDGFTATAEIRRRHPAVPIIAMTALAMQDDRERCFAAGMTDFLAKPVRRADLAGMLLKWLPRKGAVAGAPAAPPTS